MKPVFARWGFLLILGLDLLSQANADDSKPANVIAQWHSDVMAQNNQLRWKPLRESQIASVESEHSLELAFPNEQKFEHFSKFSTFEKQHGKLVRVFLMPFEHPLAYGPAVVKLEALARQLGALQHEVVKNDFGLLKRAPNFRHIVRFALPSGVLVEMSLRPLGGNLTVDANSHWIATVKFLSNSKSL